MELRNLSIGSVIRVKEETYKITGKITYSDGKDKWIEYKLKQTTEYSVNWRNDGEQERVKYNVNRSVPYSTKWLSVEFNANIQMDDIRLYEVIKSNKPMGESSLDLVESGIEEVLYASGDVDVEKYDKARFEEYIDINTTFRHAIEIWDDETEYSIGKNISLDQIQIIETSSKVNNEMNERTIKIIVVIVIILIIAFMCFMSNSTSNSYSSGGIRRVHTTGGTGFGK